MAIEHHFAVRVDWTGNRGQGTSSARGYARDLIVAAEGPPPLPGSSARVFHGDPSRWNPEQLLIAALSQCHMLSYLHSATAHGIVVTAYTDSATGVLEQVGDGGRLTHVTLRPIVTISAGDPDHASALHGPAAANCFIAATVNCAISYEPTVVVASPHAAIPHPPPSLDAGG